MAIIVGPTSWQYYLYNPQPGCPYEGGYLICESGGVRWVVAPSSTQVFRSWYCRNDAVTTAEANAACGDWFIPNASQLQNPGYTCRNNWDSYHWGYIWSSTELNDNCARTVFFPSGALDYLQKTDTGGALRAFRCVTY